MHGEGEDAPMHGQKGAYFQHHQVDWSQPFGDVAYSLVRPVSPLKNTACLCERMTSDAHSVALRSFRLRPEKCCDGGNGEVCVGLGVALPPFELGDAFRCYAPCLKCAPTPSDVTKGTFHFTSSRFVG